MTLMELLVALSLGASLSAVLMQQFADGMHLQARQSAAQDLQQRLAYTQFLLRGAIRGSASPCPAHNSNQFMAGYPALSLLAPENAAVDAMTASHVLRVFTDDCEAPVHWYYIGHGAGDAATSTGLFRRRQRSDGTFALAEELVEGVTAMTATAGVYVPSVSPAQTHSNTLSYIEAERVADWSNAFSVNLAVSVRHMTVAGEMGGDELAMVFSTALRQTDAPISGRTGP
ncbi:MAG: hypothetical protein CMQ34_14825 [Gammaproteobacteria bacterium]|nr:hypothetical protein [Gammaproteobacteria bacterium]|tara:strand:- start:2635 stop:3321 length:687 start_codon:yes stop_codon:yes gene_type:complete